jgi:cyclic pyranopterin phosphate synthase
MKEKDFTHIDEAGNPRMVDVSDKRVTKRFAHAQAIINPGDEILRQMKGDELITAKGPVFQTAIVAGVAGSKRTSDLIPFCHPLALENCHIKIEVRNEKIIVDAEVVVTGKTGVEMEALTAACIAALTIYDMCKALSHHIVIEEIKLIEKTGGKKDFKRTSPV